MPCAVGGWAFRSLQIVLGQALGHAAIAEHTSLNEPFQRWLAESAHSRERMRRYDHVMADLRGRLLVGRRFTRDEMNERCG